ncbi:MAG: glycoside hydrolase family 28 protein [Oscillospiraceae bacterium]|nr:glycoside hydrolase family 28 protein [Oscillospiraceae bacterium]
MIKILLISSTSACFELENDLAFHSDKAYTVSLNGKALFTADTNVFSVFDLRPMQEYTLEVTGYGTLRFTTAKESCAVNVRDFGAKGDGVTDDTQSIQTAIHCLPPDGRLFFPEGIYLTAPLTLKSHITLDLSENSVLLGHTDPTRYPIIPGITRDLETGKELHFGTWEGNAVPMHQALLFAEYAEDIRIIGRGVIDGNAQNSTWWIDVKNREVPRPRLLFFNRCKSVSVHGVTVRNAASWQIHPYFSSFLSFLDLRVEAPADSPNTDALDPEACDHVRIIGCQFSVGDDCIAIKSGKIEIGRTFRKPASDHVIRNCLMQFGHGAVTLGSEMAGGVRDLTVERCLFHETDRGLRIKTRRGRGKDAVIDGVTFEKIRMDGVKTPIVLNMWYNCCDPDRFSEYNTTREKLPVDERTPYLGSFTFRDMECLNCHVAACYCDGLPEMPIGEITVENLLFTYADDAVSGVPAMKNNAVEMCRAGMYFDNVGKLTIRNVTVSGCEGEELLLQNVGTLIKE